MKKIWFFALIAILFSSSCKKSVHYEDSCLLVQKVGTQGQNGLYNIQLCQAEADNVVITIKHFFMPTNGAHREYTVFTYEGVLSEGWNTIGINVALGTNVSATYNGSDLCIEE